MKTIPSPSFGSGLRYMRRVDRLTYVVWVCLGLPGGSARRRRPASFSNLLMVRSPASRGEPGSAGVRVNRFS